MSNVQKHIICLANINDYLIFNLGIQACLQQKVQTAF